MCLAWTNLKKRKVPPSYSRALPIRANGGRERGPKARARFTAVGMTVLKKVRKILSHGLFNNLDKTS